MSAGNESRKPDVNCSVCNVLSIGYLTLPNGTKVGFCFVHAYPGILSPNITIVQPKWIIEFEDGTRKHWTFEEFAEHVRKRPSFKGFVKEN
jgi:hypothetical protein